MNIDLKAKPFYLSDDDIRWVEETRNSMSLKDKVGQLFCLIFMGADAAGYVKELADAGIKPCGFMARPQDGPGAQKTVRAMQSQAEIPLLIAANLESGGSGVASTGTNYGNPLQIAATGDEEYAYKLGQICGTEGRSVGVNWSFAPIIDIDYNFHNPITNTRTFGSDPERVLRMGKAYMKGIKESNLAVSIKHWPGDGVDGRDQHLLASVNSLSTEEWDATYGKIYQGLIDEGARTVMSAHIMQPEYSRKLRPGIQDADILPASLAYELNNDLLRGQLGFNGLIVSDATPMAGYIASLPHEVRVPQLIGAGCDVFLFSSNIHKEFQLMLDGIEKGILTEARVDEAVTRILALKASLKLHEQQANGNLVPDESALATLGSEEHQQWARECADQGVTLVKDTQHLLPLDVEKHKRVLLFGLGDHGGFGGGAPKIVPYFVEQLSAAGFEVTEFDYDSLKGPNAFGNQLMRDANAYLQEYDLVVYVANMSTASNQTTVRINWAFPLGADVPKYGEDIPTVFISVANPYHLQDVPMVKTFINGYTPSEFVVDAVIEKLLGKSMFKGINPVDPFCGLWDAKR